MTRQFLLLATLAVALIGAGCATTPPYNPFKISQDEFHGKIKTIALTPVAVPRDLENPERVRAKFESLIEAKLREAGFSIVPARESGEIFERMTKQLGGFFDPVTGKRDEAKFKTAVEHTLRELGTRFNADALLYPSIVVVRAPFSVNRANWDGAQEPMITPGSYGSALIGTVAALSLVVTIQDRTGAAVYINGGGIQVLTKIHKGGFFQPEKFIPVPPIELFAYEERNVAAVNIALAPLVRQPVPTEESKPKP